MPWINLAKSFPFSRCAESGHETHISVILVDCRGKGRGFLGRIDFYHYCCQGDQRKEVNILDCCLFHRSSHF